MLKKGQKKLARQVLENVCIQQSMYKTSVTVLIFLFFYVEDIWKNQKTTVRKV